MKLAVMQPYFFPYLGYFQLAYSVDHFVYLDDVNFIKKSYIYRNSILLDGRSYRFSTPVSKISQNRLISEHSYTGKFDIFLTQLRHAYGKAPFFSEIFERVSTVCMSPEQNVSIKNAESIKMVFDYLQLPFSSSFASSKPAVGLRSQRRIIELCRQYQVDTYHNAMGGRYLYDANAFAKHGVKLYFQHNNFIAYSQIKACSFVPKLSIIDVLMHNEPELIIKMLEDYHLVE